MIRFGIIGAGNIAGRFAAALSHLEGASLAAISVRNMEKGRRFAETFSVPQVYGSAEDLLANPEIDAVYIALPHGLHREWSVKALQAGKAVLCEKPAGISADELREVATCAKDSGILFMEAMKPRFISVYQKLKEIIAEDAIGEVVRVEVSLCRDFHFTKENASYHTDPAMGGCLLDMGIYGASYICDFIHGACTASETKYRTFEGVDFYAASELSFSDGKTAFLECAFDEDKSEHILLVGEKGRIVIGHPSRPQMMTVETEEGTKTVEVPYVVDDFYSEIAHFADCVLQHRTESDIMPIAESIRCAELIDRIKADIRAAR